MPPAARSATARATRTNAYLVLLRGINIGGQHKLPMAVLVDLLRDLGCDNVRTYIQSGNAVFTAAPAAARRIPRELAGRLEACLGFEVPVILRSADELNKIITDNPFGKSTDTAALHVAFLADQPDRARAARLDPKRSPGDIFELRGREIYLHLPNGVARTKLTSSYFDSVLATTCTVRNWRTVQKLRDLLE